MYITVFLGCLVGIVVVAQTLYTSTMEHMKEFGTVKAIGGGNRDIYRILGKQASIAAVVGFVLGALMAFAMRPAMAEDRPEADHPAASSSPSSSSARSLMCLARRDDLVPESRVHRPGPGVPGLNRKEETS